MQWLLQTGTADVVFIGASKVHQLKDNLTVDTFELTHVQMEQLNKASDLWPHPYPNCFWKLFCYRDSAFYR